MKSTSASCLVASALAAALVATGACSAPSEDAAVARAVGRGNAAPAADAGDGARETPSRYEAAVDALRRELETTGTPGGAIAILEDGEVRYVEGVGVADQRSNRPLTGDTPFRLASVTKMLTAAAAMRLIEAQKLALAGRVTSYVPSFTLQPSSESSLITLEQLLSHTSGVPDGYAQRCDPSPAGVRDAAIGDWDMDVRKNRTRRSLKHDQLFGYSELLPSWGYDDFLAHVHPDDRDFVDRSYQRALSGGGDYNVELRTVWPDGALHWLWSRGRFVLDAEGRPLRAAGLMADITARKVAEEQLRGVEREETVGRLAAGIAHDFNNLLTVIISKSDLLLTDAKLDDDVRREVVHVQSAGFRSTAMVRRLLSLSRSELVRLVPLDLAELVRELTHSIECLAGDDVRVDVATPAETVGVHGDARQLEQVVLNLATNARDAMVGGGALRLALTATGDEARLDVADTGAGMDAATAARCFDSFFTTKPRGRGTGIGLASVRSTVRQMGGTIAVESTKGSGTTFTLRWPRIEVPTPCAEARCAPTLSRGAGERVLLVDDDGGVRQVAHRILVDAGYHVTAAATGEEGARIAIDEPPFDLLLTDLVLPAMTGRALAEAVLARAPATGVLLMSGYSDDDVARLGIERGTWSFLAKPFSPAELRARIVEVLRPGGAPPIAPDARLVHP